MDKCFGKFSRNFEYFEAMSIYVHSGAADYTAGVA